MSNQTTTTFKDQQPSSPKRIRLDQFERPIYSHPVFGEAGRLDMNCRKCNRFHWHYISWLDYRDKRAICTECGNTINR